MYPVSLVRGEKTTPASANQTATRLRELWGLGRVGLNCTAWVPTALRPAVETTRLLTRITSLPLYVINSGPRGSARYRWDELEHKAYKINWQVFSWRRCRKFEIKRKLTVCKVSLAMRDGVESKQYTPSKHKVSSSSHPDAAVNPTKSPNSSQCWAFFRPFLLQRFTILIRHSISTWHCIRGRGKNEVE